MTSWASSAPQANLARATLKADALSMIHVQSGIIPTSNPRPKGVSV